MKHTLKMAVIAVVIMLCGKYADANVLKLENNTNHAIWSAYATYDGGCWVCVGWIKVEPFNTREIDLGNYTGQIFIHGENRFAGLERNWGDNDMLCVEEGEAFSIRCPRNVDCKVKKMFALISSNVDGYTKFVFNP